MLKAKCANVKQEYYALIHEVQYDGSYVGDIRIAVN
jgi:hypothetical protein